MALFLFILSADCQQPTWLLINEPFCGKMFPSLAARKTKYVDANSFPRRKKIILNQVNKHSRFHGTTFSCLLAD